MPDLSSGCVCVGGGVASSVAESKAHFDHNVQWQIASCQKVALASQSIHCMHTKDWCFVFFCFSTNDRYDPFKGADVTFFCRCLAAGEPLCESPRPEGRFKVCVWGRPEAGHCGPAGTAVLRNPARTLRRQVWNPEKWRAAPDGSDRHPETTD